MITAFYCPADALAATHLGLLMTFLPKTYLFVNKRQKSFECLTYSTLKMERFRVLCKSH